MVVLVHSPHPHDFIQESYVYGLISYLSSPCIDLFLMISGALLLPMKYSIKTFLTRRLTRIVFPLIFWSVVYIILAYLTGNLTTADVFVEFIEIPFNSVKFFFTSWYLYVIIGLYLFIPIFNSFISNNGEKHAKYFLYIWGITLCYPYILAIVGSIDDRTLLLFSGYFGYMVLGYYLHNYPLKVTSSIDWIKITACVIVISIILPAVMYFSDIQRYDVYSNIIYNYLSISTVAMCVFIYIIAQKISYTLCFQKIISHIADKTFGIFLVNYAFIHYLFRPYFVENPMSNVMSEIGITFIGSLLLSYLVVLILERLPFKRYLIG